MLCEFNAPNMVGDFNQLVREGMLNDDEYSVLLSSVWQRGRTVEWSKMELIELFDSPKCKTELLMSEEEYKNFLGLKDKDITLYRCMSHEEYEAEDYRVAWTLSLKVALEFWNRNGRKDTIARLKMSNENKKQIQLKAYFNHREEKEVILIIKKGISGIDYIPKEFLSSLTSTNVYRIQKISEKQLIEIHTNDKMCLISNSGLSNSIKNSYYFATLMNNAKEKYLVEGIAFSESGKIFPHMWNRFVFEDENYENDITHDLLMPGEPSFHYYKIQEYNFETDFNNIRNKEVFADTTLDVAQLYWELCPSSKPETVK